MIDCYEVVTKLIGKIEPIGETQTDDIRFENLKLLTDLVDKLLCDIDRISYEYKDCQQYSKKRASDFACKFQDSLGIQ